jgi:hypothetical protein
MLVTIASGAVRRRCECVMGVAADDGVGLVGAGIFSTAINLLCDQYDVARSLNTGCRAIMVMTSMRRGKDR